MYHNLATVGIHGAFVQEDMVDGVVNVQLYGRIENL